MKGNQYIDVAIGRLNSSFSDFSFTPYQSNFYGYK